jgi:hypothetical protein
MRFLTIYRPTAGQEGGMPSPDHMAQMGKLVDEMTRAGTLIATEPLAVRAKCARVELKDGQFTVSDEQVRAGGYAILEAASKEEAVELAKTFLKVAGDGVTEIRQVMEFAPQPA